MVTALRKVKKVQLLRQGAGGKVGVHTDLVSVVKASAPAPRALGPWRVHACIMQLVGKRPQEAGSGHGGQSDGLWRLSGERQGDGKLRPEGCHAGGEM